MTVPVAAYFLSDAAEAVLERLAQIAGVPLWKVEARAELARAILRIEEDETARRLVHVSFSPGWAPSFADGSAEVSLDDEEALLELLIAAGSVMRGRIVGVVGAHGGAGATTVAEGIAGFMAERTDTALVDADPLSWSTGSVIGFSAGGGLAWADLSETSGYLVPGRLVDALAHSGSLRVLGADERGGMPHSGDVGERALSAIAQKTSATVVDFGRETLLSRPNLVGWCDDLLVVTSPTDTGIGAARSMARCFEARSRAWESTRLRVVVNRAKGAGQAAAAAEDIGVDTIHVVRYARTLGKDLEHGVSIGRRSRSAMAKDLASLAAACLEDEAR